MDLIQVLVELQVQPDNVLKVIFSQPLAIVRLVCHGKGDSSLKC